MSKNKREKRNESSVRDVQTVGIPALEEMASPLQDGDAKKDGKARDEVKEEAKGGTSKVEPEEERPFIVGIGASAGGLRALQQFFIAVPPDSGCSFIVVQHLDPHHRTLLPELLGKDTAMPVQLVQDRTFVRPNHVYVIPPNTSLAIKGSILRLLPPEDDRGHRTLIDRFFRSLAEDQRERAACIVLSGTGSDGTLGLEVVKEYGGITMAQAVESAGFSGMPASAIQSGAVDFVLRPDEMPSKLMELMRRNDDSEAQSDRRIVAWLDDITHLLKERTGHDFSGYKQNTLIRRVKRRMQANSLDDIEDYIERLRTNDDEADSLFQDFLISVTKFFRDPDVFKALASEIIPALFGRKEIFDDGIRIWVPACATGEEAYTYAILLCDYLRRHPHATRSIQIFATDIDQEALNYARNGTYPQEIADDIPSDFLGRYFVRRGTSYQVAKEIRDLCIFSPHNVLSDPPFSRLDLVSCRNLMIYLSHDEQKRLLSALHYGLRTDGFLVLSPSEGISGNSALFRSVDKNSRIYKKKGITVRPPLSSRFTDRDDRSTRFRTRHHDSVAPDFTDLRRTVEKAVLEGFAPPHVVIDENNEVLYFSAGLDPYLRMPEGRPNTNVIDMSRRDLRLDIRAVIRDGRGEVEGATRRIVLKRDRANRAVTLIARPMKDMPDRQEALILLFRDDGPTDLPSIEDPEDAGATDVTALRYLEEELRSTRGELQRTIEELEGSNEELKSSNEELLSMNEELQFLNEELQTSKEELQSVNEELITTNNELIQKVDELNKANSDLQNLFQNTRIATIFLGPDLRVNRFTPNAADLFRIVESDLGRHIDHIKALFVGGDISRQAQEVMRTLEPFEEKVSIPAEDKVYLLRILPYRTAENTVSGTVVTFIDIGVLERLRRGEQLLGAVMETIPEGIAIADLPNGEIRVVSRYGVDMVGTAHDTLGALNSGRRDGIWQLYAADGKTMADVREHPLARAAHEGESIENEEWVLVGADGVARPILCNAGPIRDERGEIVAAVLAWRDISNRKVAEEELRLREERYRTLVTATASVVFRADVVGHIVELQPTWEAYTGQSWTDYRGAGWTSMIHAEDRPEVSERWAAAIGSRESMAVEARAWHSPSASYRYVIARAVPLHDAEGEVREWIGTFSDIHDRKLAEHALRESESRFRLMADAAPAIIWIGDPYNGCEYLNRFWCEFTGRSFEESAGTQWTEAVHPDDREPLWQLFVDAYEKRRPFITEYRVLGADGEYHWFTNQGVPRILPGDVFAGYIGVCVDINPLKQAEQAVRRSEREVRDVLDSLSAFVALMSPDGTMRLLNRVALVTGKLTHEEIEGTMAWDLPVWRHSPELQEAIRQIIPQVAAGEMARFDADARLPDGTGLTLDCTLTPMIDAEGKVTRIIATAIDVSERRSVEEALRQSEEHFRRVADELDLIYSNTPVGLAVLDLEHRFVRVNRRLSEINHLSVEAHIGRVSFELIPSLRNTAVALIQKVMDTGEPILNYEYTSSDDGITPRHWQVSYVPIMRDGAVEYVLAVVDDVTERTQAKQALEETVSQLQIALDAAELGTWDINLRSGETLTDARFRKMFGLSDERPVIESTRFSRIIHPDDQARTQQIIIKALDPETPDLYHDEYRIVLPGDEVRWIASYGKIYFEEEEGGYRRPVRMIGISMDVTERREAENALRQGEERLRLALEGGQMGAWLWDFATNVVEWDEREARLVGFDPGIRSLDADEFFSRIHQEDTPALRAHIETIMRTGEDYEAEFRVLLPDGRTRWVAGKGKVIFDAHNRPIQMMGVNFDITSRKIAEEELVHAQTQLSAYAVELEKLVEERTANLRESMASLERFTYSVAHDLRSPLRAMHGLTSLLLEDYGQTFDEVGHDYAQRIRHAALRMDELINDLLEYGRLSQTDLPLERVDLDAEVRRALDVLREEIKRRGGKVVVDSPLPPVVANGVALRQIVVNLVGNALKFVEKERQPRVEIVAGKDNGLIRLTVSDNGIGIPPEYHQKIFGVFEKLHGQEEYSGTGIGLALVQKAADRIGARIGVESTPGGGSSFWLEIAAAE